VTNELTFEDFSDMEKIEAQYFDATDVMPARESFEIYLKDPRHIVVAWRGGRVVGFVLALSLKKQSFDAVKGGMLDETKIRASDLDLGETAYQFVYLSSIAIDRSYRAEEILMELWAKFRARMREIAPHIREVVTEPVTDEGRKIATKILKMKPYEKNPKMYFCIGSPKFFGV